MSNETGWGLVQANGQVASKWLNRGTFSSRLQRCRCRCSLLRPLLLLEHCTLRALSAGLSGVLRAAAWVRAPAQGCVTAAA